MSEESVNLESVKKVINDAFKQQKDELIDAVIKDLGQVNMEHQADVDRQLEGFRVAVHTSVVDLQEEITSQINCINRKVVGWGWVVIIAILTLALSVTISFFLLSWYHEKYLTTVYTRELHEGQTRDKGATRAIHVKPFTDAQIDSLENEQLQALKK